MEAVNRVVPTSSCANRVVLDIQSFPRHHHKVPIRGTSPGTERWAIQPCVSVAVRAHRGTPAAEALAEELGREAPKYLWTWIQEIRTFMLPFEDSLPPAFLDPCRQPTCMPWSPPGDQGLPHTAGHDRTVDTESPEHATPPPLCHKAPPEAPAPAQDDLRQDSGRDDDGPSRLEPGSSVDEESSFELSASHKHQPSRLLKDRDPALLKYQPSDLLTDKDPELADRHSSRLVTGRDPGPSIATPGASRQTPACARPLPPKELLRVGAAAGSGAGCSCRSLVDDAQLCGAAFLVCRWAWQWATCRDSCRWLPGLPSESPTTFYQEVKPGFRKAPCFLPFVCNFIADNSELII